MKHLLFPILLFMGLDLHAQKETQKLIDAEGVNTIVVSSDEIFRINLSTSTEPFIRISTRADGEYFNNISMDALVKGETLFLTSMFNRSLQEGFDKLSAHKVYAMEVDLQVPVGMKVEIISNLTSVHAKGIYDNLLVQSTGGSCYLVGFVGNAVLNTYNGNIHVETEDAEVDANSRHGLISLPENLVGSHKISLTSINGNIRVKKTK